MKRFKYNKFNFGVQIKRRTVEENRNGFTLIELILYVAIVTIVISALIPFAIGIVQSSAKSSFQQEVTGSARLISERIKYEIRNSIGINSVAATSISLIVSDSSKNPTIIDLASGKIRIKQGAAAVVNLNSNDTNVSGLTFTNYTSLDNKTKHIQFSFTITDNLTSTRQEFVVTPITIEGSAEVRSN